MCCVLPAREKERRGQNKKAALSACDAKLFVLMLQRRSQSKENDTQRECSRREGTPKFPHKCFVYKYKHTPEMHMLNKHAETIFTHKDRKLHFGGCRELYVSPVACFNLDKAQQIVNFLLWSTIFFLNF